MSSACASAGIASGTVTTNSDPALVLAEASRTALPSAVATAPAAISALTRSRDMSGIAAVSARSIRQPSASDGTTASMLENPRIIH